ncbi:MAG TPA: CapA family protein [Capillimicrobium sp.]|nr:CapA family protein [Capillimicrobium sp.]
MGERSAVVAAVGDIVQSRPIGEPPRHSAVGRTLALLRDADLVSASLEMPYSRRGEPRDKLIAFRADPDLAAGLRAFDLGVACLANNHSLDHGWEALADTMARLDELGISHVGAGADLDAAQRGRVLAAGGLRIGVVGVSCLLPVGAAAGDGRAGIAPLRIHTAYEVDAHAQMEEPGVPPIVRTRADERDLVRVCREIERLRSEADVVLVSIHWGFGMGPELAEYQRPLAHRLVDAGADAILGHHVHGLQGVEVHRGVPIVYSPGNFVAQQPRDGEPPEVLEIYDRMSPDGVIALLAVAPDGCSSLRLVPTVVDADGLPGLARERDARRIGARIAALSAPFGTTAAWDDDLGALVVSLDA